ncbi:MAG TPA: Fe-S cluster assembly ATPase SufC [Tenericutes bacterium]|nr:Fe-S cluster assembly ATPase SufC [Mycoplasmatota bacterium]
MHKLEIKNLCVKIDNKEILKDFNLTINSGEIHTIMGPNGIGKSTLSRVVMGDKNYEIVSGQIYFDDILLNDLETDERARLGIFLGMQMPIEIEGVTNADFLRTAISNKEKENFKIMNFIKKMDSTIEYLKMDKNMAHRAINVGFSGGERKKNEILQMYMLNPNMIMLDEIDSGLDVDSLKLVGEAINKYYVDNKPGILLVTHYERLLDYIKPEFVHIMKDGRIVKSGGYELVDYIEKNGYDKLNFENNDLTVASIVKEEISHE